VFATAAMAGEKKGSRETDFSSSGEIGQGAVHESLLPADSQRQLRGDYFRYFARRNLTSRSRGDWADTTQANTSEKIVSQRMPCGTPNPATVMTVSILPVRKSSKLCSLHPWTSIEQFGASLCRTLHKFWKKKPRRRNQSSSLETDLCFSPDRTSVLAEFPQCAGEQGL